MAEGPGFVVRRAERAEGRHRGHTASQGAEGNNWAWGNIMELTGEGSWAEGKAVPRGVGMERGHSPRAGAHRGQSWAWCCCVEPGWTWQSLRIPSNLGSSVILFLVQILIETISCTLQTFQVVFSVEKLNYSCQHGMHFTIL